MRQIKRLIPERGRQKTKTEAAVGPRSEVIRHPYWPQRQPWDNRGVDCLTLLLRDCVSQ